MKLKDLLLEYKFIAKLDLKSIFGEKKSTTTANKLHWNDWRYNEDNATCI